MANENQRALLPDLARGRERLARWRETVWNNSDIGFFPETIEKLRKHNLPISCGMYPKKGKRELACHMLTRITDHVSFAWKNCCRTNGSSTNRKPTVSDDDESVSLQ